MMIKENGLEASENQVPQPPPDRIIQDGFTPNIPPPKRNSRSYKTEFENTELKLAAYKIYLKLSILIGVLGWAAFIIALLK